MPSLTTSKKAATGTKPLQPVKPAKQTKSSVLASAAPSSPKKAVAAAKNPKTVTKADAPDPVSVALNTPPEPMASPKVAQKKETTVHVSVTPEERHGMICNAAYYLAERRGFIGGDPFQDWVEAEKEVNRLLGLA